MNIKDKQLRNSIYAWIWENEIRVSDEQLRDLMDKCNYTGTFERAKQICAAAEDNLL